jgi:hypothetical protein
MKSTLERYIDPANIPKKYGGELDFEFGMLPIPDPAIEEFIQWDEGAAIQNGKKTFPIGPIKWVETDTEVKAVAIGTEDGVPREKVVGRLPQGISIKAALMDGLKVVNTPLPPTELARMETGFSTQPPDTGEDFEEQPPPSSGTTTPAQSSTKATTPLPEQQQGKIDAAVGSATAALASSSLKDSTSTGPDHVPQSAHNHPAAHTSPPPDSRTGTSDTRYAEQSQTHASGQLEDGTPAVRHHGSGDKTVTMEPGTVGQAPKNVSEPLTDRSEHFSSGPGVVDQVKGVASSVVESAYAVGGKVAGAVGLASEKEKKEEPIDGKEEAKKDERVDKMDDEKVEAFMRSQVESGATAAA